MASKLILRLTAELLGTFLLVYTLAVATSADAGLGALGYVLALGLLYWLFAGVSGAHLNPIVTVSLALTGKAEWRDALPYVLAQLVGGLAGGLVIWAGVGAKIDSSAAVASDDIATALVAGIIGGFLLVSAYLVTVVHGSGFAGLGVGVAFGVAAAIGAAWVNLAQVVGMDLTATISGGAAAWDSLWIHLLAPLVGGAAAAFGWKWLTPTTSSAD